MDKIQEVKNRVKQLVIEKGLSFNNLSVSLGKNATYLQQFVTRKSPRRLDEEFRKKLAAILQVDEQLLTDVDLSSRDAKFDEDLIFRIMTSLEDFIAARKLNYSTREKIKLIKTIYLKLRADPVPPEQEDSAISNIIEIANFLKKAD